MGRVQRWVLILMNCTYTIEYVPADDFGDADGSSRFAEGTDVGCDKEMASRVFIIFCANQDVFALLAQSLTKFPVKATDILTATASDPAFSLYIEKGWTEKATDNDLVPFQTLVQINNLKQLHPVEFPNCCPNQVSTKCHKSSS